ncbi:N-acetyltransferase family protein [Aeromonas veronii]
MIRLMEEHDIPQLARLFLKSRHHTFHWVDPARFQLEDFEEQTKGEQVWVAEQGGNICGFIAIWQPDHFVHHLYVSSDWHGQGIGRALLERGLADSTHGSLKVATRNTAAVAFYHRLGWQNSDETGHCEVTGPWCKLLRN